MTAIHSGVNLQHDLEALADAKSFTGVVSVSVDGQRIAELPAGTAIGYLADGRTNVLHLPMRGAGDGGVFSTARDLEAFWSALFDGRILPLPVVERLVAPRSDVPSERRRYGLGFWLVADRDMVMLEGMDAGISCRTAHDRSSGPTYAVIANTSSGAWPMARLLDEYMRGT